MHSSILSSGSTVSPFFKPISSTFFFDGDSRNFAGFTSFFKPRFDGTCLTDPNSAEPFRILPRATTFLGPTRDFILLFIAVDLTERKRKEQRQRSMGNPKQKWTTEEEEALRAGVDKHGVGKWKNIQRDPEFFHCLSSRSNIDLKDKWRNMSVSASGQGSREKLRAPKVKAIPDPAVPASAAPVAQDAPADNVIDSGRSLQDGKVASRYNAMIFEALLAMKDSNGSDIGSIISFIEQRHEVHQNFRRLLSSKLRRLVAQDKLEKVQNCYKVKEDTPSETRAPPPKPMDIWPRQSQTPRSFASVETVQEAAAAAAYKIAETESKSFVAAGAVFEAEKMAKMAEEAESMVHLAKEIFEKCSRGEIVLIA
ncbi:hypothetical protein NE237_010345 [Protea cynaroides]|uniref:MYB transcription factor n=1 Tax=Protea cynaroides TaxID=273540 RepID=A0A9Q0KZL6_9MAGN|nr:hypothetical protein NE237_010345 [Protea cynaroides]